MKIMTFRLPVKATRNSTDTFGQPGVSKVWVEVEGIDDPYFTSITGDSKATMVKTIDYRCQFGSKAYFKLTAAGHVPLKENK